MGTGGGSSSCVWGACGAAAPGATGALAPTEIAETSGARGSEESTASSVSLASVASSAPAAAENEAANGARAVKRNPFANVLKKTTERAKIARLASPAKE